MCACHMRVCFKDAHLSRPVRKLAFRVTESLEECVVDLFLLYFIITVYVTTMLKAHLANIRSTSGLPRLDPFSLNVEGIGKRRGE